MLISHRKKFIFTKTSKTASTSVESYYEPFCMPEGEWTATHKRKEYISESGIIGFRGRKFESSTYYHHMSAEKIKALVGDEIWESYLKFTIVRNPFSKLVSAWYFLHKPKKTLKQKIFDAIKSPNQLLFKTQKANDINSFREWIKNGGKLIDRNRYFIDGKICIDYFLKYESLDEDIKKLNAILKIENYERQIPSLKSGLRNKDIAIKEFYDEATEAAVRKLFKWEIKHFGYEMPN